MNVTDALLPHITHDLVQRARCRKELKYFVRKFWDIIVPNPLVWNWHMEALCDEVQKADERVFLRLPKDKDIIANVPPGTSKTKIFSVLSTAWEFSCMPEIKVFIGSYSDDAVSGMSDETRLVMKSDQYRQWFPHVQIRRQRDNLHLFNTTANGMYYAFTLGGTLTSKHADILKIDDPLNPKIAASPELLKKVNDFFDKTLPTRKVDKEVTPTYVIMQRLGAGDPTGHLLEKKGSAIHHICFPGLLNEKGDNVKPEKYKKYYTPVTIPVGHRLNPHKQPFHTGVMDTGRLGINALHELHLDLGSYGFAGQIQQEPAPEGGLIWQKWFREIDDLLFPSEESCIDVGNDWDLAYTKDKANAASCYMRSGKYKNSIYIFDFDWRWLEIPELIKWMKAVGGPHYIEAKASGKSAKQILIKQGVVAIEIPVKGGADKIARARSATPVVESGLVYIKKSMAQRLYSDPQQGLLFFPKGQFKDLADVTAQAIQRQSAGGLRVLGNADADPLDDLDDYVAPVEKDILDDLY